MCDLIKIRPFISLSVMYGYSLILIRLIKCAASIEFGADQYCVNYIKLS